jgi:acetyl esterase/lipase
MADATKFPIIPARELPLPASVSAEARAVLAFPPTPQLERPPLSDKAAWRSYIAGMDERMRMMVRADGAPADVAEIDVGGAKVYDIRPHGVAESDRSFVLEFHGGALIAGAGAFAQATGVGQALRLGARVWSVDYRMPPDHPYPAGLDDALAAYRGLLKLRAPEEIIVAGSSAGGNIAAAVILRARDEGLPLPGGAILMTPELDLTESGDSFRTNLGVDNILGPLMPVNLLYADGADLAHPYLSPLFGDVSKGFPPTLLASGTRDLFLSNTVRMHWALLAADVRAELYVVEAGPHGGFPMAPEGAAMDRQLRRFAESIWASR